MKSRDAQYAMTQRVQAAFAKWRSFEDMPEVKRGDVRVQVQRTLDEFGEPGITQESYVKALYAACYDDSEPVGRDGDYIVAKAID
jgi:hypothetical protein